MSLLLCLLLAACSGASDRPGPPRGWSERGIASWYGPKFHGRATASGEIYDMEQISAAHKSLPFGTVVRVRNVDNGRELDVRINDRGPFVRGRVLDLSRAAARRLGMLEAGIARVRLTVVRPPPPRVAAVTRRSGPVVIQIAAFRDRGRAERLVEAIRRRHPGVAVYAGDGWHRVQFRAVDPDQAERLMARLSRDGHHPFLLP